jgi:hypothetical protein
VAGFGSFIFTVSATAKVTLQRALLAVHQWRYSDAL